MGGGVVSTGTEVWVEVDVGSVVFGDGRMAVDKSDTMLLSRLLMGPRGSGVLVVEETMPVGASRMPELLVDVGVEDGAGDDDGSSDLVVGCMMVSGIPPVEAVPSPVLSVVEGDGLTRVVDTNTTVVTLVSSAVGDEEGRPKDSSVDCLLVVSGAVPTSRVGPAAGCGVCLVIVALTNCLLTCLGK